MNVKKTPCRRDVIFRQTAGNGERSEGKVRITSS